MCIFEEKIYVDKCASEYDIKESSSVSDSFIVRNVYFNFLFHRK